LKRLNPKRFDCHYIKIEVMSRPRRTSSATVNLSFIVSVEQVGIAIRISDPSGAKLAIEKVMSRRKKKYLGNQDVRPILLEPCLVCYVHRIHQGGAVFGRVLGDQ
jgi:hypothetical protein